MNIKIPKIKDPMRSGIMSVLACLTLAFVLSGASPAMAVIIVSDNFTNGTPNTTLNGQLVQTYDTGTFATNPLWNATAQAIYSTSTNAGTPSVITISTNTGIQGLISVPNVINGVLTLQADVRIGNANWIGLTFANSLNIFSTNSPLLAILNTAGNVSTFENGTSTNLTNTTAYSGFQATNTYTFKMVYDLGAQNLSTYINGTLQSSNAISGLNNSTINYIGFAFSGTNDTPGSPQLGNFSYTVVPEPSSIALISSVSLLGLGLYAGRRLGRR
jgi:hypothetical protein